MPTTTTTAHPLAPQLIAALGEPEASEQYGRGFTGPSDPVIGLDFGMVRVCLPVDPDERITVYGFTAPPSGRRALVAWEAEFGGSTPASVILAAVLAAREAQA